MLLSQSGTPKCTEGPCCFPDTHTGVDGQTQCGSGGKGGKEGERGRGGEGREGGERGEGGGGKGREEQGGHILYMCC